MGGGGGVKSLSVGVPGLVDEAHCSQEETVFVAWGFGPDGLQPPARWEFVSRVKSLCPG